MLLRVTRGPGLILRPFLRYESTRHRMQAFSPIADPSAIEAVQLPTQTRPNFMDTFKTWDLACFTMLSFVTANKPLLKFATKILPYTPTFLIKAFVCPVYSGGETTQEVRNTARKLLDRGIGNVMLSYCVEDADGTKGDALEKAVGEIKRSMNDVFVLHNNTAKELYEKGVIKNPPMSGYIALKPTGIKGGAAHALANYDKPEYREIWESYLDSCRDICRHAAEKGQGKVVIVFDAEKTWLQDGVYAAQRQMMREFNRDGKIVVCGTLQMYLQNSLSILKHDIALAREEGWQVAMKLVRGAYIHSEPDRWNVIHRTKEATDECYDEGVNLMATEIFKHMRDSSYRSPVGRLIVASHNYQSCDKVDDLMTSEAPPTFNIDQDESIVFGQLLGMNEDQSTELGLKGRRVVKYVPWGPPNETKDYLVRRLEENGDAARGGWSDFQKGCAELWQRARGKRASVS